MDRIETANAGNGSEWSAEDEVRDLRREKQELEAQNALLTRQLSRSERKDAAITVRMPLALHTGICSAARRCGFKSPASFLFELLARLQERDLETAFKAFEDPAFGTGLAAAAQNLRCGPGEVLRVIAGAMPGELCRLYEERQKAAVAGSAPETQQPGQA